MNCIRDYSAEYCDTDYGAEQRLRKLLKKQIKKHGGNGRVITLKTEEDLPGRLSCFFTLSSNRWFDLSHHAIPLLIKIRFIEPVRHDTLNDWLLDNS